MPISSAEIAAASGAFLQQSAANLQYSNMIGAGGFQPAMADALSGSMMNRAAGAMGPMAMGVAGLAGLDPMSLGLKAGMGVFGRGGSMLAAGGMGLGVAGVAGLGYMAASAVGNQMMTGAQQQSQLNQTLRQNFNFMSPYGQGFSRQDMTQIGGTMRAMTHQAGPGGEVVSMNELTQLAGNMGKMGMSTGVRDAQEFSRKFREMVSTLKTVAQEMGTSLQEAQQFMNAQKSSGLFKMSDQAKFATQARGTALGGGLALSEVTSMANIGSQISRSTGGLGRSGAFGGMKTIGQIGSAMQVGAVSEEDIYNATGLTGAEGRQAMATNMMASSANFLRSGRGRRFLASVAGKDGTLDEDSVNNWMNGGMDVGDTMRQGSKNLGRVGRANFIRNEGRLRGAALEKFGGLAQSMAYSQWLGSRGYDPTSMDDRSMLAFQRFSGMGRDEADAAIKMVAKLPEILQQQKNAASDDRYMQESAEHRRTTGVEGAKRKLDQMREGIQSKIQGVGQDIYNSTTDMVERLFNKALGVTERRVTADINEMWRSAKMGGSRGSDFMTMLTSSGGGGMAKFQGGADYKEFMRNQNMKLAADIGGAGGSTKEIKDFAAGSRDWMRTAYTNELAGLKGEDRMRAFERHLTTQAAGGNASAKAMLEKWKNSGSTGQAGILASAEKEIGVGESSSLSKNFGDTKLGMLKGEFATLREGDISAGRNMLGVSQDDTTFQKGSRIAGSALARTALTGLANFIAPGLGGVAASGLMADQDARGGKSLATRLGLDKYLGGVTEGGGEFGRSLAGRLTGSDDLEAGAGSYLRSRSGLERVFQGLTGGAKGAEGIQDRLMEMASQGELSNAEKGEQALLKRTLVSNKYKEFKDGRMSEDDLKAFAKQTLGKDVSTEDIKGMYNGIGSELTKQMEANRAKVVRRVVSDSSAERSKMTRVGIATLDKDGKINLSAQTLDKLKKGGLGKESSALQDILSLQEGFTGDTEKDAAVLGKIQEKSGQMFDSISKMSVAQKKTFAQTMAGTEFGDMAGASIQRQRRLEGATRGKRGDAVGGLLATMGLDLDKDDLAGLKGKSNDQIAAFYASKMGIKDEKFEAELAKAVEAAKGKKTGEAADLGARAVSQSDNAKKAIENAQKDKDPGSKMVAQLEQSNNFLRALVDSNKAAKAALDQIVGNTGENKKDGEK